VLFTTDENKEHVFLWYQMKTKNMFFCGIFAKMADMLEKKDDERHHKKEGGVLENLTEQRMQEQMVTLERFYEHYDQAQWAHAVDMEHEVLLCLQAVLCVK